MAHLPSIVVRPERPDDHPDVFSLNLRAFGRQLEAQCVERLRQQVKPLVSLVALADQRVIGHALFSPIRIDSTAKRLAMGVGPVAVHPDWQGRGIGTRLLEVGIDACRIGAIEILFVTGKPTFYRRFGFRPAQPFGLRSQREYTQHPLLVAELRYGALDGLRGSVDYPLEWASEQAPAAG
jgi:putative acetyltransferase